MDLVGGWVRQLLGAGIVAALVPLAIVAALVVVVAGSGGLGGLGSLGQLVTGPAISPAQRAIAETTPEPERAVALVAPPTIVAAVPPPAAPGAAGDGGAVPGPGARPPERVVPLEPPVVALPPAPPVAPPAAAPAPAPAPAPPTARDRTEKVVAQLAETVDGVVGVVGEVIGGVGETLGGILDGPPPRR